MCVKYNLIHHMVHHAHYFASLYIVGRDDVFTLLSLYYLHFFVKKNAD